MRRMNTAVMYLLAGGGLGLAMIVSTAFGATDIPLVHLLGILARVVGVPAEPRWQPWEATVVMDVRQKTGEGGTTVKISTSRLKDIEN